MTEDEIYRASTQFRLWNFTPEILAERRTKTNALAIQQVRAAFKRKRELAANASATPSEAEGDGANGAAKAETEVPCLTPEGRAEAGGLYLLQSAENGHGRTVFGEYTNPRSIKGTAVQFLKRFYLSHSPMDYHPRTILPTVLFLATKTENVFVSVQEFADKLATIPGFKKSTVETVLAPEFILTQGLRFCFDVRHPFRALRAFFSQELAILKDIAKGGQSPAGFTTRPTAQIQKDLLRGKPPQKFLDTVSDKLYVDVRNVLSNAALLSDAYFLYTPAQIHFAAWYIHNPFILEYYLELKLSDSRTLIHKDRLMKVIRECAILLEQSEEQSQEDMAYINKKLVKCQNPDKKDLVNLNKAKKRDGVADGEISETVAKKRKLQREKNEKESEDLFGPSLIKPSE